MVAIKKGDKRTKVPFSAYKSYYQNAGWVIDDGTVETVKEEVVTPVKEEVVESENTEEQNTSEDEEDWDSVLEDDELEKPLSEMNREELEKKAKSMGVDITGLTTNKQIREAIRNSN